MENSYRQLKTILWKHRKVRTRNWLLTLLEVTVPIAIFVSVAYARSKLPQFDKEYINATYIDPLTDELLSTALNVRDTKIFFAPKTEFTDNLVREVQLKLHLYNEAVKGFRNRDDILRYYREIGDEGITIVIIFDDVGHVIPKVLKYDIQMYEEMIYWETDKLFRHDILYMPGVGSERYIGQQFIPTQWALETSFIEMVNNAVLNTSMTFQEFPYPPHWTDNGMMNVFTYLLPLLVILSFTFLFPSILRLVVMEKSSGIKQLMKINGLKSWAYWLGWFVNGFSICIFSVITIVVLLTSKLFHDEFAPLEHADFGQLMVLLLLYCSATISFIFAFSTLFNKALLAMISGIIFWFVVYITFIAIATNMEVISLDMKLLMSLLPNIALYYGIGILSDGEIRGDTVGWTELSRNSDDDMTMVYVVMVLAFDTIFYIFLAWAFDTDPTGKYKITACCKRSNKTLISLLKDRVFGNHRANNNVEATNEEKVALNVKYIEDNQNGRVLLEIQNLRKTYGQVVALKDLDIKIYSGTLTALLGHNGAGKTTTMSILAGLTQETCGSILLPESDEVDLKNRQLVSICPQENLLLSELTVKEHLQFFGLLKGLTLEEVNKEIETLLKRRLNLYDKRHDLVKTLSGGMKRKLAIGIAVMGRPKILILDEPTAGIDPEGRRAIWDLISALKGDTTILMSTHLMEEAEELADRVAIIDDGELECYGTPFYLKDKYHVGFHFTVNVEEETHKSDVRKLIRTYSQTVAVDKPNVLEYNFDHSDKEGVGRVLQAIEKRRKSLAISDYKISALMLEDIFHKIRKSKECKEEKQRTHSVKFYVGSDGTMDKTHSSLSDKEKPEMSCFGNFCRKTEIIAKKKFLFLKNTSLKWFPIVAIFYLLVLLTFALGNKGFKDVSQDGKTLKLQLDTYGSHHVHYSISPENSDLQRIYESIVNKRGISPINTDNVAERILERGERNLAEYKTNLIVASEFTTEDDVLTHINVMYSNQAVHGAPISLNLATNALIKLMAGDEYSIIGSNSPLRSVNTKKQNVAQSQYDNLLLWTTMLPLGALFPAMISLLLPTVERNNSVKTMSLIYNIRFSCYWLSSYLIDLFTYIIIILPVIIVLWMTSLLGLLSLETIAIVMFLVIFMIYGITIIPVTYLISTYSKSVASACASFLVPNMCISTILVGVVLTLEIGEDALASTMRSFFALNPHFTFSYLLSKFCIKMVENHNWDIKTQYQIQTICEEKPLPCCIPNSERCEAQRAYIDWNIYMIWSFVGAVICLTLVMFLDSDLWKLIKAISQNPKSLTNKSLTIISSLKDTNMSIRATEVKKSYGDYPVISCGKKPNLAVNELTFDVKKKDCFALLGVNGAGKSTTFRMITKQELPNDGKLAISTEKIGYCPQEHAMIGDLTGKQMLTYFAHLQNYDISDMEIDQLLEDCGLSQIANRLCKTYSGGNKRKLNTCIALIGNPEIIALDEPTTGVDPDSRRKIQDLIRNAKGSSGIVFTSHSMDECERLCDNVGIMKEGKIANNRKSIVELKEDYAVGHIVRIKLNPDYKTQVITFLEEELSKDNVEILDDRSDVITACVKNKSWSELLTTIEHNKRDGKMGIQDYIVQESSLEHVFLTIARYKNSCERNNE